MSGSPWTPHRTPFTLSLPEKPPFLHLSLLWAAGNLFYKLFRASLELSLSSHKSRPPPPPPPAKQHRGWGWGQLGRGWGVRAGDQERGALACTNSESDQRKRRCSYLHEQFDLRLFFSHGCVGDQEAAVAGGTGRGPGKGRRVSRPGILLQTQGCPSGATRVRSDPLVLSNAACPQASAPHTQLLHLGSSRLAQGAADSPAGPALDLGRGHEGRGLGDRGSGSGTEARGLPEIRR